MKNKSYIVILFFLVSLFVFTLVNVLQTIAWGQQTKVYPKYPIEVGRVKPGTVDTWERWKTEATYSVTNGKDANLYVKYSEDDDEFILMLEATKEHAATDGYIPPLKIVPTLSNMIRLQARKE